MDRFKCGKMLPVPPFCNSLSNKVGKFEISAPQIKCSALKFPICITVLEGDWTNLPSVTFEAGQTYFFTASTTLARQHPRGELGFAALVNDTLGKKKKKQSGVGRNIFSAVLRSCVSEEMLF